MNRNSFEREVLGFPINVALSGCGNDTLVKITGGCAPHIGSVSVAYLDSGEPSLRTLLLPGHRDDVVSDMFAEALSKKLGANGHGRLRHPLQGPRPRGHRGHSRVYARAAGRGSWQHIA